MMPSFESYIPEKFIDHALLVLLDAGVIKGMAWMLLATAAMIVLRRSAASSRHLLWTLSLAGLILMPALSMVLPRWNVSLLPQDAIMADKPTARSEEFPVLDGGVEAIAAAPIEQQISINEPKPLETGVDPDSISVVQDVRSTQSTTTSHGAPDWRPWVVALWLAGFLVLLMFYGLGLLAVNRLHRKAYPMADGPMQRTNRLISRRWRMKKPVPLMMAAGIRMPLTCGFFRSVVLLPEDAETWTEDSSRWVLHHEIGHVKRRDCLKQGMAHLALALNWFNPLAWWACRCMRLESEKTCDDLVLKEGAVPDTYADFLLRMVRLRRFPALTVAAAIPMARRSVFEGRILALLDERKYRGEVSRWGLGLAMSATLILLSSMAMIRCAGPERAVGETDAPEQRQTTTAEPSLTQVSEPSRSPALPVNLDQWKGWPQYRGTPDHNNFRSLENRIRFPKVLWRIEEAGLPAVVGDDVYTPGASLRLIHLQTGEIEASWKPEGVNDRFNVLGVPLLLEDRVIVHCRDSKVYALTRPLDRVLWSTEIEGLTWFSGVSDGEVFVISGGARVAALDCSDGGIRWERKYSRLFGVNMTPAIAEGKALFGSTGGVFYALRLEDGEEAWCYEGNHPFGWTDPVAVFGKVYVGDRGGVINAIDLETGELAWSRVSGMTGLSEPGILPGMIVVGFGRVVRPYDAETGADDPRKRSFSTGINPFGSPTLVGDTLYFGNLDGHLYAFDFETEKFKWAFEVGEKQQVLDFIYHEDILLVQTTEGLYALGNDPDKGDPPMNFVLTAEKVK